MIRGLVAVAVAVAFLGLSACRTAPADIALPVVKRGAAPTGEAVTLKGRLVRSGTCLALEGGGGGTTVVIWPISARARTDGGGTVVVVWPFRRTDPPIRSGEQAELTGIVVTDNITDYARIPDDPACRSGRYLVLRPARPAG